MFTLDWQRTGLQTCFWKDNTIICEPKGCLTSSGHACCCCSPRSLSQEKISRIPTSRTAPTPASLVIPFTSRCSPDRWVCLWRRTTDSLFVPVGKRFERRTHEAAPKLHDQLQDLLLISVRSHTKLDVKTPPGGASTLATTLHKNDVAVVMSGVVDSAFYIKHNKTKT